MSVSVSVPEEDRAKENIRWRIEVENRHLPRHQPLNFILRSCFVKKLKEEGDETVTAISIQFHGKNLRIEFFEKPLKISIKHGIYDVVVRGLAFVDEEKRRHILRLQPIKIEGPIASEHAHS